MSKSFKIVAVLIVLIAINSCKKEEKIVSPANVGELVDTSGAPAVVVIEFKALANNMALIPTTKSYSNTSADMFTVTKFTYYVSNLKLKREDGYIFSEPESYHLIKHVEGKTSFTVSNLPSGNYTSMEFLIGVDSLRNVSGVQSGDLDVSNGMFWDWNTGYIFYKLEGAFVSNGVPSPGSDYAIHVGGFSGEFNCLQKTSLNFNSALVAKKKSECKITVDASIDEVFVNPKKIGFDYYYDALPQGPKIFQDISVNYKDMFTINKIQN